MADQTIKTLTENLEAPVFDTVAFTSGSMTAQH
jgi:hypothetical protein